MSKRSQTEVNSSVGSKVPRVVETDPAIQREQSRVRKQTTRIEGASNSYIASRDEVIHPADIWVDDDGNDSDDDVIAEFKTVDNASTVATQPKEQMTEAAIQTGTPAKTSVATKFESGGDPESCGETESIKSIWLGEDLNVTNLPQVENKINGCNVGMRNSCGVESKKVENNIRRLSLQIQNQDVIYDSDESTNPDQDSNFNTFSPDCSPRNSADEDEIDEEVNEASEELKKTKKKRTSEHCSRGNKLVAHLKTFENIELAEDMCEGLPTKLREYAELGKYKFQSVNKKGEEISAITLFLTSAFIHKSALLKLNQTNLGKYGCMNVKVTEKMLALLICILTKYRHDKFDYSHLLECEKYLEGLNHPSKAIWECAKEEMRWIQDAGNSPFQTSNVSYCESKSELIFDDLFSRHRDLELDTKIFLICLTESESNKNLDGHNM